MGRKILLAILACLMSIAAAVQLNDPDPLYWTVVYASTTAIIAGRAFDNFSKFWAAVVIGGVVAGMLIAFGGFVTYVQSGDAGAIFGAMLSSKPYVEESREFLGLAIALTALIWCYRSSGESDD